jgi:hypothetical protein
MPYLVPSTERRPTVLVLSQRDIVRSAREVDDLDVLCGGETVDLLPLGQLIGLTERARAA